MKTIYLTSEELRKALKISKGTLVQFNKEGCNPRPYDWIWKGEREWIIKIEQPGLLDISFSTSDPECVKAISDYKKDIYGYLVTKPDGEELFISGTARITRKEAK